MVEQGESAAGAARRQLDGSQRRVRASAQRVGPADPGDVILVSIYVRQKPGSPPWQDINSFTATPRRKRERVPHAELVARYSAATEDLALVSKFATDNGLSVVTTDAGRRLVQVSGTADKIAAAFAVELSQYKSPSETYRGYEGTISLPEDVATVVEAVLGLDNRRMARRAGGLGTVVDTAITPPMVAYTYNFPTPKNGAAGQSIAILEFGGGFAQSDLDDFIADMNNPAVNPQVISPGGPAVTYKSTTVKVVTIPGSPGNVMDGNAANPGDSDTEVAADVQIAVSVAQGADVTLYFAPWTEQGWVDALTTIFGANPDVLSISWGWAELEPTGNIEWTQQTIAQITAAFASFVASECTVFVATGDNGTNCEIDDGKAHVVYPASDPWITACGGTTLKSYLSPNSASTLVEQTWRGTGGGLSYLVPVPDWQANVLLPPSANGDNHAGRGLPDMAGNADPGSGYNFRLYGYQTTDLPQPPPPPVIPGATTLGYGPIGGTSTVAPLYAALVALINATLGGTRTGFLNQTLYSFGGSTVFRDMNDGISNAGGYQVNHVQEFSPGYKSGPGWDACTGWGVIDGCNLVCALTNEQHGAAEVEEFSVSWSGDFPVLTWTMKSGAVASGFEITRYVGKYTAGVNPDETAQLPAVQLASGLATTIVFDDEGETNPGTSYQYRLLPKNIRGQSTAVLSNILQVPKSAASGPPSGNPPSKPQGGFQPTHPVG